MIEREKLAISRVLNAIDNANELITALEQLPDIDKAYDKGCLGVARFNLLIARKAVSLYQDYKDD